MEKELLSTLCFKHSAMTNIISSMSGKCFVYDASHFGPSSQKYEIITPCQRGDFRSVTVRKLMRRDIEPSNFPSSSLLYSAGRWLQEVPSSLKFLWSHDVALVTQDRGYNCCKFEAFAKKRKLSIPHEKGCPALPCMALFSFLLMWIAKVLCAHWLLQSSFFS